MARKIFYQYEVGTDKQKCAELEKEINSLNFKGNGEINVCFRSKANDWWSKQNVDILVKVSNDFDISVSHTISPNALKQYLLDNGCLKESSVSLNQNLRCNKGIGGFKTINYKKGKTLINEMRTLLFKKTNEVDIWACDESTVKDIEVWLYPKRYVITVNSLMSFEDVKKYLYDNGVLEDSKNPINKQFFKEETAFSKICIECQMEVEILYEKFIEPLDEILKEKKIGFVDGNEIGFFTHILITLNDSKQSTQKNLIKTCKDFVKTHKFPAKAELLIFDDSYELN